MNHHSTTVLYKARDHVPSERIYRQDRAYRTATDARKIAAEYGCPGDMYEALTALMERERVRFLTSGGAS
ncbi:MAG: hypothetical protein GY788_17315 [bacterium]|nr:hypothetical protein [bacterium]